MIYAFEGISEDLPRPPMSALRALLAAGVLLSARAWQELPVATRQAFAQAGAMDPINDAQVTELLKQVPVSQVKFVGKRGDPPIDSVPVDLANALGPARPLTVAEWAGLRALDRHTLVSLVKNTRLLSKALNEVLPQKGAAPGIPNVWSGSVARTELRVKREVLKKVLSIEFMDGRAFTHANVSGRRAARRASELFDQQSDATVGPVEIDWGLRVADDVLFWQAHVSAWDGAFFPGAALLAANTAATAMYDMVKGLDPSASIIFAAIREEPWQAGREEQHDAPTGMYAKGSLSPSFAAASAAAAAAAVGGGGQRDTIQNDPHPLRESSPLLSHGPSAYQQKIVPSAPSSTPSFSPSVVPSSRPTSSSSPRIRELPLTAPAETAKQERAKWIGIAVIGLIVLANLMVIFGIAVFLGNSRK